MSKTKYTRDALLKSKSFSFVQKDFLGVILSKPEYTIEEAETEINKFLGRSTNKKRKEVE